MVAEPVRRSRFAWPTSEPPEAPAVDIPPHRHRSARRLWAAIIAILIATAANTYLGVVNYQYVQGRGVVRDRENAALQRLIEESNRTLACGLLDGLPAGPLFDPKREQYGCGPGIPYEELTPEVQDQLQQFSSGIPAPAEPVEPPSVVRPRESPEPPQETSAPVAPTPVPAPAPVPSQPGLPPVTPPAPTAPPLVDLTPITDTLCDGIGICL